jgi:hypothetical protein
MNSLTACQEQGSFFWLQNTEGELVVGVFATNHQPQVLSPYFAARKKNPGQEMFQHCSTVQWTDLIPFNTCPKIKACDQTSEHNLHKVKQPISISHPFKQFTLVPT